MKNKSIRNSLFALVVLLSIFSYTYLNSVSVSSNVEVGIENIQMEDITAKNEATLPDVKIIEKAANLLKNMLPVSN